MGSVSVSSCRCCMFVSCVHPVAVLNADFQLVDAGRGCNEVPLSVSLLGFGIGTMLANFHV